MDYGKILERSWQLTWKHKYLWILGFFAALGRQGSGSGGGSNANYSFSGDEFSELPEIFTNIGLWIGVGIALFILGLIFWLVSTAARGGLITAVERIENGERLSLGAAFAAGTEKLGRLIGMNLLLYAPIIIVTLLLGGLGAVLGFSVFASTAAGVDPIIDPEPFLASIGLLIACVSGLLCLLAPYGLVAMFIQAFSFRGVMLQDLGMMESIRHGWQVLRANFTETFLLAILFLGVSIIFGFVTVIILLPAAALVLIPMFATIFTGEGAFTTGLILYMIGGFICLGLLGAAINSILTVWQSSAFTMAYLQFTEKKPLENTA